MVSTNRDRNESLFLGAFASSDLCFVCRGGLRDSLPVPAILNNLKNATILFLRSLSTSRSSAASCSRTRTRPSPPVVMADRQPGASSGLLRATAIIALIWFRTCAAHEHGAEEIPEGETITLEPIVRSSSECAKHLCC